MRYKKLKISGQFLIALMTEGTDITGVKLINGLPKGTRFAYSIPDSVHGIVVVIEHESFPELNPGDLIPEFLPYPTWTKE